jgi:hypothetical protein
MSTREEELDINTDNPPEASENQPESAIPSPFLAIVGGPSN